MIAHDYILPVVLGGFYLHACILIFFILSMFIVRLCEPTTCLLLITVHLCKRGVGHSQNMSQFKRLLFWKGNS